MKIQKVHAIFFSPTGTTKTVVSTLSGRLAERLNTEICIFDFTLPAVRETAPVFSEQDLVVLGVPVYAGRVPNLMLKFIQAIQGRGALGVPVVLYGNRDYGDALMELKQLMATDGFHPVAGAALVGQHSFSEVLAAGQPDNVVLAQVADFADKISDKVLAATQATSLIPATFPGNDPIGPYFKPLGPKSAPIDIRKVKPKTSEACVNCGACAIHCPMGAIDPQDVSAVPGICIKCHACIKHCPADAKYFDDPDFLFHKRDLETRFAAPIKPPVFVLN